MITLNNVTQNWNHTRHLCKGIFDGPWAKSPLLSLITLCEANQLTGHMIQFGRPCVRDLCLTQLKYFTINDTTLKSKYHKLWRNIASNLLNLIIRIWYSYHTTCCVNQNIIVALFLFAMCRLMNNKLTSNQTKLWHWCSHS